jgi:hypothetical protein
MLSPSQALLLSLHHLHLMNDVQNAYHYISKYAIHLVVEPLKKLHEAQGQ